MRQPARRDRMTTRQDPQRAADVLKSPPTALFMGAAGALLGLRLALDDRGLDRLEDLTVDPLGTRTRRKCGVSQSG
jgi:hypothetical protein